MQNNNKYQLLLIIGLSVMVLPLQGMQVSSMRRHIALQKADVKIKNIHFRDKQDNNAEVNEKRKQDFVEWYSVCRDIDYAMDDISNHITKGISYTQINRLDNAFYRAKNSYGFEYNPINRTLNNEHNLFGMLLSHVVDNLMNEEEYLEYYFKSYLKTGEHSLLKESLVDYLIKHGASLNKNDAYILNRKIVVFANDYQGQNYIDRLNHYMKVEYLRLLVMEIDNNKICKPLRENILELVEKRNKTLLCSVEKEAELQIQQLNDDEEQDSYSEEWQELQKIETLNYVMNEYEKIIQNGMNNDELLRPHIRAAIEAAQKEGLDNKIKREKLLRKLRNKNKKNTE